MNFHPIFLLFVAAVAALALAGTCYVLLLALVGSFSPSPNTCSAGRRLSGTRFLVLIPAHNEEEGIRPTLESLRGQDYPENLRRVIVIADNCQDRTAAVVRQEGFECWERTEPDAPGKGRALRWALDRLREDAFDAAVFIDADTRCCPGFLEALDGEIQTGASALQGQYEFELADSSYFSLLTFASKRAENNLFWRARQRFGWMGFILGNGFCLKREIIEMLPWSAYSIVEDVEYSVQLAMRGIRVQFLESAQVVSRTTRRAADALPQRLRWASGTFQVMAKYIPQLLRASLTRRSLRLAEMALALVLTSRFFLLYLLLVAAGGSILLGTAGAGLLLRIAVITDFLLLSVYAGLVLSQIPRVQGGRLRAFVTLPFYVCWMALVHAGAALGIRRNIWGRTTR
ncbi:MAG: glycosyltransferase [Acidobacteriia bacterium]|nr:glycosyltransferase [Terriglobia bacterium]